MALFTNAFVVCALYAFMVSGAAFSSTACVAASAVAALITFPLIALSAFNALKGVGATAPRTILAFLQIPFLMVMINAVLAMARSIVFLNLNLRKEW